MITLLIKFELFQFHYLRWTINLFGVSPLREDLFCKFATWLQARDLPSKMIETVFIIIFYSFNFLIKALNLLNCTIGNMAEVGNQLLFLLIQIQLQTQMRE